MEAADAEDMEAPGGQRNPLTLEPETAIDRSARDDGRESVDDLHREPHSDRVLASDATRRPGVVQPNFRPPGNCKGARTGS
jgi:hypothetical protein